MVSKGRQTNAPLQRETAQYHMHVIDLMYIIGCIGSNCDACLCHACLCHNPFSRLLGRCAPRCSPLSSWSMTMCAGPGKCGARTRRCSRAAAAVKRGFAAQIIKRWPEKSRIGGAGDGRGGCRAGHWRGQRAPVLDDAGGYDEATVHSQLSSKSASTAWRSLERR